MILCKHPYHHELTSIDSIGGSNLCVYLLHSQIIILMISVFYGDLGLFICISRMMRGLEQLAFFLLGSI